MPHLYDDVKLRKELKSMNESLGGKRYNEGKLMFQLIPPEFEEGLAAVLTKGAELKYDPRNWEKGLSMDETVGSLKRHLNDYLQGNMNDKESGQHHMLHVAINAMFLFIHDKRGIGKNDIPAYQASISAGW